MSDTTTTITVWMPALRRGAPSNAAGQAPGGPYRTRREALEHEHWANQASYATAFRLTVSDGSSTWVDRLGVTTEDLVRHAVQYDNTDEVAAHLRAGRWASALKAAMRWED